MLAPRFLPRSLRQTTVVLLLLVCVIWLATSPHQRRPQHVLLPRAFDSHLASSDEVSRLCAAHGFPPAPKIDGRKRRVYDLFHFSGGLDWLEIRLNTLYQYVDYIIITESDRTTTGEPKPLLLQDNWGRFDTFHRKLIYVTVGGERNWGDENVFLNASLYEALPTINGTEREPRYGDALIAGDIDEVPRPETINLLRYCDFPDRLTLRSHSYQYSFQWLRRGEQRALPQATVYRGLEQTISPAHLRNGKGGSEDGRSWSRPLQRWRAKADLFNAGWHCAFCFRTMEEMKAKIRSSSQVPHDEELILDSAAIVEKVRNGWDLLNRKDEIYDKITGNVDMPPFILRHWQDYRYMLARDGEDAGFEDVKDMVSG